MQAAKVGELGALDKKEGSSLRGVIPVTIRIFRMAREGESMEGIKTRSRGTRMMASEGS